MKKTQAIEIMSPVGSYESLMAAIQGGAGSVYFGIDKLNMRSKSSINFTIDDLRTIVSICREHNVQSYLTMNTVMYENDLALMREIIDAAAQAEISAVIAADMAVIVYARSKGVEVHISTQLNVSNFEALKFYAQYADVVVLARELTLVQVRSIYDQIIEQQLLGPNGKLVRIEMFVHGALCMAVSGKCYLSLHELNHSANRGQCLQICRRAYTVTDKETGLQLDVDNEYIMSPKDLCTIGFLDEVLDAGVSVLKIEGRARAPEYVKLVTTNYKKAVEAWREGSYSPELANELTEQLKTVFNRGFWGGYYLGQKLGEWSKNYGSEATQTKQYIAKCTNFFANLNVAEFLVETGSISVGDKVLILGPTSGVVELTITEIRVDLKPVETANKGERCSIALPEKIRRADKLYKIIPTPFALRQNK